MAKHISTKKIEDRDFAFVYSEDYLAYKFHDNHPFNQKRVRMTYDLLLDTGMLIDKDIIVPRIASDEEILLFHSPTYVDAVKKASTLLLDEKTANDYGLGTEDTPIFKNMHDASARLVGGTLSAVDAVLRDGYTHALNLGGGLHHGFSNKASGFCIYNDSSIAIKYIQKKYGLKVLYIDTDAHHGDGVQWGFYDDPNVCTLSIHETGKYLFPGTGDVMERGKGAGYGYCFNIPLDAYTEDESFLEIYKEALWKICEFFKPDIILSQNGVDAHYFDPLTHLHCSIEVYKEIPKLAHEAAHTFCDGKWIAVGGGGYDYSRVVPRAWSYIWFAMTGAYPTSNNLPTSWVSKWQSESSTPLITTWDDPKSLFPIIPRKGDIEDKNSGTLKKALNIILK